MIRFSYESDNVQMSIRENVPIEDISDCDVGQVIGRLLNAADCVGRPAVVLASAIEYMIGERDLENIDQDYATVIRQLIDAARAVVKKYEE